MIKLRIQGISKDIQNFKNRIEKDYEVLKISDEYPDRGKSTYSRIYLDINNEKSAYKYGLKNKEFVKEIEEDATDYYFKLNDIPRDIIEELLKIAIVKIDELQNGGEYDERDAKDSLCDMEFIFEDIVKELQRDIELGVYEEEDNRNEK